MRWWGRQTRAHLDLDLAVDADQLATALALLGSLSADGKTFVPRAYSA